MRQSRLAFMLTLGFALVFYATIMLVNIPTDIPVHAEDVEAMIAGGQWPGH